MPVELQGQIERITYTNDESGFTIAKLNVAGQPDLITVVGNLLTPMPGEILRVQGEWVNHPKYGRQLKLTHYESVVPASAHGIEKYLGSGLIKGIGPVMAKRMVKKFGKETLDIIEKAIARLTEVEGIGEKRIQMIQQAWNDQKEIRQVMLFLQSHGVSSGYAVKIFKQYGDRAIAVVKTNPYRLAQDIFGIGFVIADTIARKLGFAEDAEVRVQAGILYVLQQLSEEGHVYYPYNLLVEKSREILEVEREVVIQGFDAITLERKIAVEDLNLNPEEFRENNKAVYLAKFHLAETGVARYLKTLVSAPKSIRPMDTEKAVAWVQERLGITLAPQQREAIKVATGRKMMVITGGPGTGKTTIINAILKIFARIKAKVLLAAPTGRAAKRMAETTGFEAKTIHRLLEYSLQKGGFQRNEEKPLECDLLILDEASMIDLLLMHYLLRALPPRATLILVGDVNQLPSVGAGNVLKDIIGSGLAPVVELNEIFRQAKESLIIVNAHKINAGLMPALPAGGPELTDFYFIAQEDPQEVVKT
ncbi:MAG: ATP-dependent RecD-like DNA helicase, partial [Desulfobacteraceae bacterium]